MESAGTQFLELYSSTFLERSSEAVLLGTFGTKFLSSSEKMELSSETVVH